MSRVYKAQQKREKLFRDQRGRCAICDGHMRLSQGHELSATLDHVIPRSKGGGGTWTNLRLAHRDCNTKRGSDVSDVFIYAAGLRALRWNIRELEQFW